MEGEKELHMNEDKTLEILKQAILLERRGKAFYSKVAEQSKNDVVKEFFEMMAREEVTHLKILSDQYRSYMENKRFVSGSYNENSASEVASAILNTDLKEKISAADFEAAAISAAMSMEERAVRLYSVRATSAIDAEEKALYQWLAEWETSHLELLAEIDRELTERIWFDNQFWPF
jgi:rubrerythrin